MSLPSISELSSYAQNNGGFTVDPVTFEHLEADAGFIVAAGGNLEMRVHIRDYSAVARAIREMQLAIEAHRKNNPHHTQDIFIGGWVDPQDPDILLVEVVEHIYGLERAVITGRHRKQQAIFSLKSNDCISLEFGKHNQG